MIDRLFSALLTFCLLAGGTAAIGSALLERHEAAPMRIVTLPPVTVTGKRPVPAIAQTEALEPAAQRVQ